MKPETESNMSTAPETVSVVKADVSTITEANVAAFLRSQCERVRAKWGTYAVFRAEAHRWCDSAEIEVEFGVAAGRLSKHFSGSSVDAAFEAAEAETPERLAAEKRAAAARLLAEADQLDHAAIDARKKEVAA